MISAVAVCALKSYCRFGAGAQESSKFGQLVFDIAEPLSNDSLFRNELTGHPCCQPAGRQVHLVVGYNASSEREPTGMNTHIAYEIPASLSGSALALVVYFRRSIELFSERVLQVAAARGWEQTSSSLSLNRCFGSLCGSSVTGSYPVVEGHARVVKLHASVRVDVRSWECWAVVYVLLRSFIINGKTSVARAVQMYQEGGHRQQKEEKKAVSGC